MGLHGAALLLVLQHCSQRSAVHTHLLCVQYFLLCMATVTEGVHSTALQIIVTDRFNGLDLLLVLQQCSQDFAVHSDHLLIHHSCICMATVTTVSPSRTALQGNFVLQKGQYDLDLPLVLQHSRPAPCCACPSPDHTAGPHLQGKPTHRSTHHQPRTTV